MAAKCIRDACGNANSVGGKSQFGGAYQPISSRALGSPESTESIIVSDFSNGEHLWPPDVGRQNN
jgi:hypothetical protein